MTILVMDQLDQTVQLENINIPVLIDQLVRDLLTRNVLVIIFLMQHIIISFLSNTFNQSSIAEHVRLEIIFTSYFVQIVYSLVELVHSDIEIQNSVVGDKVHFDIVVLHFLEQRMRLIYKLLIFFFFLITHTHMH